MEDSLRELKLMKLPNILYELEERIKKGFGT
jgi:hypothetical protein